MLDALAIAVLGFAEGPSAERIELEWSAPPGCPQHEEVTVAAARLLLASDGSVRAHGTVVERDDGQFELTVEATTTTTSTRHTHVAEVCDRLGEIAALFVAVAADPAAIMEEVSATPPPASAEQPVAIAVAPAVFVPRRDDPPPPTRRDGGWLRVHAIVGAAQLPGLDAGLGIAGAWSHGRFSLVASVAHLFARERELPGLGPAYGVLAAWNTGLHGCFDLGRGRWRVGGCVGPEIGAITGRARDVDRPGYSVRAWVAATAGPLVRVRVGRRVQIHGAIEGVVALRRPTFALRDDTRATIGTGAGGVRGLLGLAIGLGAESRDQSATRRRYEDRARDCERR